MVDGCTPFAAFWRIVLPNAAPGLVARHPPGRVREAVPDRLPAAVGAHRSLHLIRRRCRSEAEAVRIAVVHPFTAPAVRPLTSQRCVAKKAISTGSVDTTPAAISCAVLSW